METIKNYLENMFSHLPNTSEVQKAKYELYQMMEDKYNELISEGNCLWSAALHNRKSWTDIQRMHSAFTRFTGRI